MAAATPVSSAVSLTLISGASAIWLSPRLQNPRQSRRVCLSPLVRCERAPHEQFDFVAPERLNLQALHVSEQHIPERPVEHRANPVRVVMRDFANQLREVAEVAGAALSVRGTFPLRLEDF